MKFPVLSTEKLIQRLKPPRRKIRVIMDTDTFNEIDDQFAVAYALKSSERIDMQAFFAAPFFNERSIGPKDGMEKSYNELNKILSLMGNKIPVFKGSDMFMPDSETPVGSDASSYLAKLAMESSEEDPLYVVSIGAITNVASAILTNPDIIQKIVVVWLGGHALHWKDTREFNLYQDVHAARIILDSGVPLVLIPCMGVASHLVTTLSEVRDYIKDQGEIGKYLYEIFFNVTNGEFARSRVIWDISTIAFLNNDTWTPSVLVHSPIISNEGFWSVDMTRHFIRYVQYIKRDEVFCDFFMKLKHDTCVH